MTVQLEVESADLIQQKVASGRYRDAAAVIREALDALEERERLQRLRALVADGFASAEEGDLVELTPELMEEPVPEGEELDRLGQPIDPDVCP